MNFQLKPLFTLFILAFTLAPNIVEAQTRNVISMNYKNGIYTIPCEVNGLTMKFIFDSGASTTQIGLSEALFMLKNDYLSRKDLGDDIELSIADGSTILGREIQIRSLKVGNQEFKNIDAIIVEELSAPLLLGQNIMSENSAILIDYENSTIEFILSDNSRYNSLNAISVIDIQLKYDSLLADNLLLKSIIETNNSSLQRRLEFKEKQLAEKLVDIKELEEKYNNLNRYVKQNILIDRRLSVSDDIIKLLKKKGDVRSIEYYEPIYDMHNRGLPPPKAGLKGGDKYYELGVISGYKFIITEEGTTGWIKE